MTKFLEFKQDDSSLNWVLPFEGVLVGSMVALLSILVPGKPFKVFSLNLLSYYKEVKIVF